MALGTNRGDAEDLAQSAWARGWERLFQLRDDANILGWVYAIDAADGDLTASA
jgi:DNA-directed RNA polymerase specialized sigma24 family protein